MLDPRMLAQMGRRGDTMVAHISPQEAEILKLLGGSGSINPQTGLPEFYDSESDDPGGVGGIGSEGPSGMGGGFGIGGAGMAMGPSGFATPEQEADRAMLDSILGDMAANARHNESIGAGGPGTGYIQENAPGWLERQIDKGKSFMHNFGVDPLGTLTPSYTTIGSIAGLFSPMPGGFWMGRGIGSLADQYGFTAPTEAQLGTAKNEGEGDSYTQLAQNMISGPSGVSQAQQASQPESAPSFDRQAFGQFGQGLISGQAKSQKSGATSGAADRGMGAGSGQLQGQLAIQNQQSREKMKQFAQLMSDPNMGYQDLNASLMNILA